MSISDEYAKVAEELDWIGSRAEEWQATLDAESALSSLVMLIKMRADSHHNLADKLYKKGV